MEPVNNQDVLIRLLKDGYISNDEFKSLYDKCNDDGKSNFDWSKIVYPNDQNTFVPLKQYDPFTPVYPSNQPFIHLYDPTNGPFYNTN